MIARDPYGAREDADNDTKVGAIVSHFRQRMKDGTYLILAGPPKDRTGEPNVAKDSKKVLSQSLKEHDKRLKEAQDYRLSQQVKNRARIYLGSFNEATIKLYNELEHLQKLLKQTYQKKANLEESKEFQNQKQIENQIKDITFQIKRVEEKIQDQGPDVPRKLKSYLSVA